MTAANSKTVPRNLFDDDAASNSYPIWIGLTAALAMVSVANYPAWWMLTALGIGANGLVIAANSWKMPVRGLQGLGGIRHTPMLPSTRRKWLADIIPVGFGKASIGDFLLLAGVLGSFAYRDRFADGKLIALLCLIVWASGWSGGFRLFKKWTSEARHDAKKNILIVLTLIALGSLFHIRGCGIGELRASVQSVKNVITEQRITKAKSEPASKWRSLGNVSLSAPDEQFMERLKLAADREEASVQKAIKKVIALDSQQLSLAFYSLQKAGTRKGPFCRVTCSFHHGTQEKGTADVEVDENFCKAKTIPHDLRSVWGWRTDQIGDVEYKNPWPGPAGGGLDAYKIYWKETR